MAHLRLLRICFCLILLALPALALGRPSGQSGAAAPSNVGCIYLPMVGAGGQAAATITTAQSASPCDGLAAAPEPSPTTTATSTVTASVTASVTSTSTAMASATATDTATSTATATGTVTVTSTATTSTATPTLVPSPTSTIGPVGSLSGPIEIWPEYENTPPPVRIPLQIVIVLDVSGSMSANTNGQCNNTGSIVQCAAGPGGSPAVTTQAGANAWWNPPEERRIAVAKKSAQRLIELLNMAGNAGYEPTSPSDEVALVWFNNQQATSMTSTWSSTASLLKQKIDQAGAYNADSYRTDGGNNGAAGLYRASLMLKSRTGSVRYNGRPYDYQRLVLFISDGMANHFLDTTKASLDGGPSSAETYAQGSACRALGAEVLENAPCQTTDIGGMHLTKGWDRPITQMVSTSRTNIQNDPQTNAQVYVISPGAAANAYLKSGVASFPSYFFPITSYQTLADGTSNVDFIADGWATRISFSCEPKADGEWRSTFPPESAGNVDGLTYPVIGKAVVEGLGGIQIVADIRADYPGGKAKYTFTDLPAGTYALSTYIFYRHPLDPPEIMPRRYSLIETAGETLSSIEVVVNAGVQQQFPVRLKLLGNVCAGL